MAAADDPGTHDGDLRHAQYMCLDASASPRLRWACCLFWTAERRDQRYWGLRVLRGQNKTSVVHKSVVKRERKEERADRSILHFRRAKQYSVPHFDHLEELLQARRDGSIKVDGIIVATPNQMHVASCIVVP